MHDHQLFPMLHVVYSMFSTLQSETKLTKVDRASVPLPLYIPPQLSSPLYHSHTLLSLKITKEKVC